MTTGALKLGFPLPLCSTSHRNRSLFRRSQLRSRPISSSLHLTEAEVQLVDGILGIQGRGRSATPKQLKDVELAVRTLEQHGGVPDPTRSSLIQGRWKLIFTTRPGTASPIQRTFVGVDVFTIFQEIFLDTSYPRVSNIVQFSDKVGDLKVEAEATVKDGNRILFQFDQAAFSFKFLPFKIPYPVPFRLLGDEAKGWLDTTYLSTTGNIRISRGNKGTTFVLQKKIEPRQQLLSAISSSSGIEKIIDELISISQKEDEKVFDIKEGKWQLLWCSKMPVEGESISEMANVGSIKGLQIIKKNGHFENVYSAFPGLKIFTKGQIKPSSRNIYHTIIRNRVYMIGSLEFPLDEIETEFDTELLYSDNKMRISKGYKQKSVRPLNLKKYAAILRRKEARARYAFKTKSVIDKKPYLHETRHRHGVKRTRCSNGRFEEKKENKVEEPNESITIIMNLPSNSEDENTQFSTEFARVDDVIKEGSV